MKPKDFLNLETMFIEASSISILEMHNYLKG